MVFLPIKRIKKEFQTLSQLQHISFTYLQFFVF